jgi:hypothetical protein
MAYFPLCVLNDTNVRLYNKTWTVKKTTSQFARRKHYIYVRKFRDGETNVPSIVCKEETQKFSTQATQFRSRDSSGNIRTSLRAGRPGVQIPAAEIDFSLSCNTHTGSGGQLAS